MSYLSFTYDEIGTTSVVVHAVYDYPVGVSITTSIAGPGLQTSSVSAVDGNYTYYVSNCVPNSPYTITVIVNNTDYYYHSFTTLSDPTTSPPGGTSDIRVSAVAQRSPKLMNVSWNSVSYASGYRLYWSDDNGNNYHPVTGTDGQVGDITSYQVVVDYEWQYYRFQVTATNAYGNGPNIYSSQYKSYDSYAPSIDSFYVTQQTSSGISVVAHGYDNVPDYGSVSGVSSANFYLNGSYITNAPADGNGNSFYTFTGLTPGSSYTLSAEIIDAQGNVSGRLYVDTIFTGGRPYDFTWDTAKNSGSSFDLTALEWNKFTKRINDFRAYKGISGIYTFSVAYSGNNVTYSIYNEAVYAISAMNPPSSLPSTKNSGDDIYASYLNSLVASLNSIQ